MISESGRSSMMHGLTVLAGFITILGAILWIYKERALLKNWGSSFIPYTKKIGIRQFYVNRKKALNSLYEELQSSSTLRVMNLKGYSVVEEADIPDTFLYRLLSGSNVKKRVEILIHFPDSPALEKRTEELGEEYSLISMCAEHNVCVRKIEEISRRFQNAIKLRFFQEPLALWNMVIWDNGILLGWYASKSPSHKGACIKLERDSIFGRQLEKYFDAIWYQKSVSSSTYQTLLPFYPSSSAYPANISSFEDILVAHYNRPPSRKNAFVIFIGGGAGTGKSTLAWQLAHSIGVRNIISTDMVRQLLRQSDGVPEVLMDETWEAWRHIGQKKTVDTLYEGLKKQANILGPAVASLAKYALSKGMPTIIEGIHILPDTEIVTKLNGTQNLLFFIDAPDYQIERNFEMRKYSTHMRTIRKDFVSLEDRKALHYRMLKLTREKGFTVVQGGDWNTMIDSAKNIVAKHFGISVSP